LCGGSTALLQEFRTGASHCHTRMKIEESVHGAEHQGRNLFRQQKPTNDLLKHLEYHNIGDDQLVW